MLVRIQFDALLLDSRRTPTHCDSSENFLFLHFQFRLCFRFPQLNLLFLLNIIRVLVVKLRESHTSDVEQVRKAVRAAFVLLPLLGITNLLNMTEAPLDRSPLEFAVWSYITHFLTSFQGFFIAMIYCFLNGEVSVVQLSKMKLFVGLGWKIRKVKKADSLTSCEKNTSENF